VGTKLDDIIEVNITRETARITRQGFGTTLLAGETAHVADRVTAYTDPADMLDDGFETTDNLYIAAVKLMGQSLSPETFKIGRKQTAVNEIQVFTLDALASAGTFTITLGDGSPTAAIDFDATSAEIETAIELLDGITSVTVTGEVDTDLTLTIEFDGADVETAFADMSMDVSSLTSVSTATQSTTSHGSSVDADWETALNAIRAADDDWYFLIADTRADSDIEEIADWLEPLSTTKLYFVATSAADLLAAPATDIASVLGAKSYDRTMVMYSADEANFPEAAWVGGQSPEDPGSITWKFKNLSGITADALSGTAVTNLKSKNANFYETIAGTSIISSEAITVNGEFIDIMRGVDWLTARIGEAVYLRLINEKKIPLTDAGIAVIETELRSELNNAVEVGLIAPNTVTISVPEASDLSSADKAVRLLDGISFTGTLAGAVHKTIIVGKLTV